MSTPLFRFFSHTADAGLEARGRTLPDLFRNAALGMTAFLTPLEGLGAGKKVSIRLQAESWESLLVDWLNEVLYRFAVRRFAAKRWTVRAPRPFSIHAQGAGGRPKAGAAVREVKAVTYHALKIRKTKSGYRARIVLDI